MVVVYNDGLQASDVEEALVGDTIGDHIAALDGISIYGHPLQPPATARTVRVRDGLTLVSDGPFAETKEHIAGFDLLDCDSREQAVALAATHPLAWFNKLEVRPLAEPVDWTAELRERLEQGPGVGQQRYTLLICSDGIATAAKTEVMRRELPRWVDQVTVSGACVIGCILEAPEAGVLVRVRGPHTLTSDEPFAANPAEVLAASTSSTAAISRRRSRSRLRILSQSSTRSRSGRSPPICATSRRRLRCRRKHQRAPARHDDRFHLARGSIQMSAEAGGTSAWATKPDPRRRSHPDGESSRRAARRRSIVPASIPSARAATTYRRRRDPNLFPPSDRSGQSSGQAADAKYGRVAGSSEPTRGLEPRTPSLRVKCSTS